MASNFELVDAALFGKLPDRLKLMRNQGLTLDEMALRFQSEGVNVSRETVRRWCHRVGIDTFRQAVAP